MGRITTPSNTSSSSSRSLHSQTGPWSKQRPLQGTGMLQTGTPVTMLHYNLHIKHLMRPNNIVIIIVKRFIDSLLLSQDICAFYSHWQRQQTSNANLKSLCWVVLWTFQDRWQHINARVECSMQMRQCTWRCTRGTQDVHYVMMWKMSRGIENIHLNK